MKINYFNEDKLKDKKFKLKKLAPYVLVAALAIGSATYGISQSDIFNSQTQESLSQISQEDEFDEEELANTLIGYNEDGESVYEMMSPDSVYTETSGDVETIYKQISTNDYNKISYIDGYEVINWGGENPPSDTSTTYYVDANIDNGNTHGYIEVKGDYYFDVWDEIGVTNVLSQDDPTNSSTIHNVNIGTTVDSTDGSTVKQTIYSKRQLNLEKLLSGATYGDLVRFGASPTIYANAEEIEKKESSLGKDYLIDDDYKLNVATINDTTIVTISNEDDEIVGYLDSEDVVDNAKVIYFNKNVREKEIEQKFYDEVWDELGITSVPSDVDPINTETIYNVEVSETVETTNGVSIECTLYSKRQLNLEKLLNEATIADLSSIDFSIYGSLSDSISKQNALSNVELDNSWSLNIDVVDDNQVITVNDENGEMVGYLSRSDITSNAKTIYTNKTERVKSNDTKAY